MDIFKPKIVREINKLIKAQSKPFIFSRPQNEGVFGAKDDYIGWTDNLNNEYVLGIRTIFNNMFCVSPANFFKNKTLVSLIAPKYYNDLVKLIFKQQQKLLIELRGE